MKVSILILLLVNSLYSLFAQNLEFYKEDLCFEVKNQHLTVYGIYYFANTSGQTLKKLMYYPFATDKNEYGIVDSIELYNKTTNKKIEFIVDTTGISFIIIMEPYETSKYYISYRQKLLGNKAEYLLLTTKSWSKALEQANYKLKVNNYKVISFSIQPDSVSNNNTIYYWNKQDYMPESNMIFMLESKK